MTRDSLLDSGHYEPVSDADQKPLRTRVRWSEVASVAPSTRRVARGAAASASSWNTIYDLLPADSIFRTGCIPVPSAGSRHRPDSAMICYWATSVTSCHLRLPYSPRHRPSILASCFTTIFCSAFYEQILYFYIGYKLPSFPLCCRLLRWCVSGISSAARRPKLKRPYLMVFSPIPKPWIWKKSSHGWPLRWQVIQWQ